MGALDSAGAFDSGTLSADSGELSEILSETRLSSLEDDVSDELVLVEAVLDEAVLVETAAVKLALVKLAPDDAVVDEKASAAEPLCINEGAEASPSEVPPLLQAVIHNANAKLTKTAPIFFIIISFFLLYRFKILNTFFKNFQNFPAGQFFTAPRRNICGIRNRFVIGIFWNSHL